SKKTESAWENIVPMVKPRRILEVGSFEGASATYFIRRYGGVHALELHCVDSWEGGAEHALIDMTAVEQLFDANLAEAMAASPNAVHFVKHKGRSDQKLAQLIARGRANYFDLAYIDGSHQAPDVLFDALAAFRLVRPGGLLIFDDYLWTGASQSEGQAIDLLSCPKPAIDAFTNLYRQKINLIPAPLFQLFVAKTSD
ncbi:MAG: class I SAM-dependent methyltransferase, partial [Betaproteobacteria bacterium]|nr:class I SAM-dependent methyltransferase [Betaproteobacteria bacterium]